MAQNKLSFELTPQLKAEFESYLYNEAQKNNASDEWHALDSDHPKLDQLERRIKIFESKLVEQVRMAAQGYKVSNIKFITMLNEYSENKTQK